MNQRCLQVVSVLLTTLFLTSCVSATTPTPLPTESPTLQSTATLTLTPEPTVTPTEIPAEIKSFPQVTPENYKDCVVTPDQLEQYRTWLKTLSKPFPADTTNNKIKYNLAGHIIIDPSMARFDATACTLGVGDGALRILMPIEVKDVNSKDPTDPKNNIWILAEQSLYWKDKQLSVQKADSYARIYINAWRKDLNSKTIIVPGSIIYIAGYEDPFIAEAQKQVPGLQAIIDDFVSMKDLTSLGSKGIILLTAIYTSN